MGTSSNTLSKLLLSLLERSLFPLGADFQSAWKTSIIGKPDVVAGCTAVVRATSQTQRTRKKLERGMLAIERKGENEVGGPSKMNVKLAELLVVGTVHRLMGHDGLFFVRSSKACFSSRLDKIAPPRDSHRSQTIIENERQK